jgi:hypothetical protein
VDLERTRAPVRGEVPSFSNVARISAQCVFSWEIPLMFRILTAIILGFCETACSTTVETGFDLFGGLNNQWATKKVIAAS